MFLIIVMVRVGVQGEVVVLLVSCRLRPWMLINIIMHRTVSMTQNYPTLNVSSPKVEKHWSIDCWLDKSHVVTIYYNGESELSRIA